MRRHVPVTTTSCRPTGKPSIPHRRRAPASSKGSAILEPQHQKLSLADKLVRRFSTGRWPMWRVLARRGHKTGLVVAVQWLRARSNARYSLIEVPADAQALSWRNFPSARQVRAALASNG